MNRISALLDSRVLDRILRGAALVLVLVAVVTVVIRVLNTPSIAVRDAGDAAEAGDEVATALVTSVTQRSAFNPTAAKQTINGQLSGILGDKALFGGQWAGVGETVMDARIVTIGPDWVEYEFEGKTTREFVFGPGKGDGGGGGKGRRRDPMRRGKRARRADAAAPAPPDASPMSPDAGVPPHMLEHLRNMNSEQRDAFLENLPAAVRDRVRESL